MGNTPSEYECIYDGKWCKTDKHIYFILGAYYGRINTNKRTIYIRNVEIKDEYMLFVGNICNFRTSINAILIAYSINRKTHNFENTMSHFFIDRNIAYENSKDIISSYLPTTEKAKNQ